VFVTSSSFLQAFSRDDGNRGRGTGTGARPGVDLRVPSAVGEVSLLDGCAYAAVLLYGEAAARLRDVRNARKVSGVWKWCVVLRYCILIVAVLC
jgi:hypothetical protein